MDGKILIIACCVCYHYHFSRYPKASIHIILSQCSLENALSSDIDSDLKFQSKVILGSGEIGKTGSTYNVQCQVKQGESVIYKATGTFILEPVKFLKAEFRHAIGNKDFDMLWNKLDINGE